MGWQQGKGLGAKESGITEHVKVSYKNDTQGEIMRIFNLFVFILF